MIKISILDDHKLFRLGLKELFRTENEFTVISEYETAKTCLDEISHQNLPDILLVDISLEEGVSFNMISLMRAAHKNLKFVILSGHKQEYYLIRAIEVGVNGYINKDVNPDELFKGLRKIHMGGTYFSRDVAHLVIDHISSTKAMRATGIKSLSQREKEILGCIVNGSTSRDISDKLIISKKTVETHRSNILRKFGFKSTTHMVHELTKCGVI